MTDLETMIRSWADRAADGGPTAVTADEAIERSTAAPATRRGPRRVLAAAAVALLAVSVATVLGTRGGGGDDVVSGPPQPSRSTATPDGVLPFRLLGAGEGPSATIGTVAAATTVAELDDLWSAAGLAVPAPDVDLRDEVVVSLAVVRACGAELGQLDAIAGVVQPDVEIRPCGGPSPAATFVVAIDWQRVGAVLHVRLPGALGPDVGSRDLVVARPGDRALDDAAPPDTAAACVADNPVGQDLGVLPASVADAIGPGGAAWGRGSLYTLPVGPDFPVQDAGGRHDVKLAWFRAAPGDLTLSATRTGGGGTFVGEVPSGYQPVGLQVSGLSFDRAGCWVVTGRHEDGSELTFRLWVP
ncbi:hypothetical protein [Dermatobacter hominis]|uniref:hypothetical protein n=1 Tax=Dermatobacter hominis TaxID=2884263 RepID=UPI001D106984|nr:hypothetical protein [Dermatobacter hominis]UDY36532.1 hypothetical protein LH044_03100 [Dermatobacter hominis]